MDRTESAIIVRWILITAAVTISYGLVRASSELNCPSNDLSWFRQNAKTLLFMEHFQKLAVAENLYNWSSEMDTEEFQQKLNSLENKFVLPEEMPDECYEQMYAAPQGLIERIGFIEDRLQECSSSGRIGNGSPCYGGESGASTTMILRRMSVLQTELMRQRNVLRTLRVRLMTVNRQLEGK